ncbi:hypothetical protein [Bradyrhizobium genosp. P]|uniref:hypothetical protein n=1 Tax=Bradyrhizobium genosp. P TaxID=83641 RepID=UPI003CFA7974
MAALNPNSGPVILLATCKCSPSCILTGNESKTTNWDDCLTTVGFDQGTFSYAVLADVNEPKKSCHGVRKARAEVAAHADCTESQMMAMFGWTDPKMPAHYIAQANREKLGITGMEKIVAFD